MWVVNMGTTIYIEKFGNTICICICIIKGHTCIHVHVCVSHEHPAKFTNQWVLDTRQKEHKSKWKWHLVFLQWVKIAQIHFSPS